MPADPSVFNALAVQPRNALQYAQDYAEQDLRSQQRQQNALALQGAQAKFQDDLEQRSRQRAVLGALQGLGAGATDDQRIGVYEQNGMFDAADKIRQGVADRAFKQSQTRKQNADSDKTDFETTLQRQRAIADLAGSATDQASWTRARNTARLLGADVSQIPEQFDPQQAQQIAGMALSQAQRFEQHIKEREFGLKQNNELIGANGQVNQPLLNAKKQVAAAGKASTTVSVNTGQKGYENESKLRNDFKQEPIYKDFNDMKSAHAQITSALQQASPIADTAAATKIMKLLDPGSVVRESELGMAMAAAGKMDRLQNMAQMWASGQKLTPTQRKDFKALADELMDAASQAYNSKRSEYAQFGKGYGLNEGVLGPAASSPKSSGPAPGAGKPDDIHAQAEAILRGGK